MLLDVQLDAPPQHVVDRADDLVDAGVAGLFTFEGPHDVFLPLAAAASAGVEADLMTNIAVAIPRSPMHLAHLAWDLQTMSRGRFRLGLGSQIKPHIEKRYGATWSAPAARMREITLATKAILDSWQNGTPLDFRGEHTQHTLMPPTFVPGPNRFGAPPVLLGALGPLMTRTAAEVSDGLLVMPFCSEKHLAANTAPAIQAGLDLRDDAAGDFATYPQAICGLLPDESENLDADTAEQARVTAREGVRGLLAFYSSTPAYKPVLDAEGWGDIQPELNRLSKVGEVGQMMSMISDDMLTTLAVVGTPAEVAARLRGRFSALPNLSDRVCVYFPGQEPPQARIRALVNAMAD